jgi:hypothetical protein
MNDLRDRMWVTEVGDGAGGWIEENWNMALKAEEGKLAGWVEKGIWYHFRNSRGKMRPPFISTDVYLLTEKY